MRVPLCCHIKNTLYFLCLLPTNNFSHDKRFYKTAGVARFSLLRGQYTS